MRLENGPACVERCRSGRTYRFAVLIRRSPKAHGIPPQRARQGINRGVPVPRRKNAGEMGKSSTKMQAAPARGEPNNGD